MARLFPEHRDAAELLAIVAEINIRSLRKEALSGPFLKSTESLEAYLHAQMAHADVEHFRVLFLNSANALIRDELMWQGTTEQVPVYPREILKRAFELSATALILIHNHPSGNPSPSKADISMTRAIVTAASLVGIKVHDHVVIARSGNCSFRALGLL